MISSTLVEAVLGVVLALVLAWILLVLVLMIGRPRGSSSRDTLRVLPDLLRTLRRLASDRSLPRSARVRLWVLLAYLAFPIDVIPDFIPVIGYADDAIVTLIVLRSVVRKVGPNAIQSHWPGDAAGLASVLRLAGIARRDTLTQPESREPS